MSRYETHSADQFMYWRHTWRCWHDENTVSEFEAIEYKPGPLSTHAHTNPTAYAWAGDTPWTAELVAEHSTGRLYPDHSPVGYCALLNTDCYYVLGNVDSADALLTVWIEQGHDDEIIWTALRARKPLASL